MGENGGAGRTTPIPQSYFHGSTGWSNDQQLAWAAVGMAMLATTATAAASRAIPQSRGGFCRWSWGHQTIFQNCTLSRISEQFRTRAAFLARQRQVDSAMRPHPASGAKLIRNP
jgi:hypothetical protein